MLAGLKSINTMQGIILVYVSLIRSLFTVYILTGFFGSLPQELEDCRREYDGCKRPRRFRGDAALASPGILTSAIFQLHRPVERVPTGADLHQDPNLRPLSLSLYSLKNAMTYSGDWRDLFAGVVIVIVPTVVLFHHPVERMISGITLGRLK